MSNSFLRVESLTGQPIKINNTELRVCSQVIRLQMPVINGGLIWNRPVAVLVRTSDGQEQILSIPDWTRIAILMLAGLSFTSMSVLLLFRRHKVKTEIE